MRLIPREQRGVRLLRRLHAPTIPSGRAARPLDARGGRVLYCSASGQRRGRHARNQPDRGGAAAGGNDRRARAGRDEVRPVRARRRRVARRPRRRDHSRAARGRVRLARAQRPDAGSERGAPARADRAEQGHRGRLQLPQPPRRHARGRVSRHLLEVPHVGHPPRGRHHLLRGRHRRALRRGDGAHHRQDGEQRRRGRCPATTSSRWRRATT